MESERERERCHRHGLDLSATVEMNGIQKCIWKQHVVYMGSACGALSHTTYHLWDVKICFPLIEKGEGTLQASHSLPQIQVHYQMRNHKVFFLSFRCYARSVLSTFL